MASGSRSSGHTIQGDKKFASVKIDSYKINSGLTPDVMGKKP